MTDLTPQPEAWPSCPTCQTAWALRRALDFRTGEFRWAWFRVCKHKATPVLTNAEGAVLAEENP